MKSEEEEGEEEEEEGQGGTDHGQLNETTRYTKATANTTKKGEKKQGVEI